jgi:septal ring factor EnvC (AmiA/AmiB activator)
MTQGWKKLSFKGWRKLLIPVYSVFFICLVLFMFPFASSQNQSQKDKLLDKKKQIESEIEYYKQLLSDTKKSKELSLNRVNLLKNQISKREDLIDEINSEVGLIDKQINENNQEIRKHQENLQVLKDEYARMIYNAYKSRHAYTRLMFIFAANDFDQAYQRLRYFQQYNDYRRKQVELIAETQGQILLKNKDLRQEKENKNQLLQSNEQEKQKLAIEKAEKDKALKGLKKKESEIKKALKEKQAEAAKLKGKIESLIAEEINKSAKKTNKTVTATTTARTVLTPEEKLLSDNFISNKGKLPWPVESGVISSSYGEHPHPVLDGIKVKNNGIDIATKKGSAARAVFNGIVTSIIVITNTNKAVLIRHGDYFTVYSNLESVSVSKGQNVSTKQRIGTVYTGDSDGKTELHFEVWEGKLLCNPVLWLAGR